MLRVYITELRQFRDLHTTERAINQSGLVREFHRHTGGWLYREITLDTYRKACKLGTIEEIKPDYKPINPSIAFARI